MLGLFLLLKVGFVLVVKRWFAFICCLLAVWRWIDVEIIQKHNEVHILLACLCLSLSRSFTNALFPPILLKPKNLRTKTMEHRKASSSSWLRWRTAPVSSILKVYWAMNTSAVWLMWLFLRGSVDVICCCYTVTKRLIHTNYSSFSLGYHGRNKQTKGMASEIWKWQVQFLVGSPFGALILKTLHRPG